MYTTSNHSIQRSSLHSMAQQGLPLLNGSFATRLKFPKDDWQIRRWQGCLKNEWFLCFYLFGTRTRTHIDVYKPVCCVATLVMTEIWLFFWTFNKPVMIYYGVDAVVDISWHRQPSLYAVFLSANSRKGKWILAFQKSVSSNLLLFEIGDFRLILKCVQSRYTIIFVIKNSYMAV